MGLWKERLRQRLSTYIQMYQNDMKMVLDRYTAIQEGFGVKPRHMLSSLTHVKLKEKTRKELQKT